MIPYGSTTKRKYYTGPHILASRKIAQSKIYKTYPFKNSI